jgi:hypothetical protein
MRIVVVLCIVGLSLGLGACSRKGTAELYVNQDYEKYVSAAAIDPKRAEHVRKLLEEAGIPNIVEGSVVYGVSVPPDKKEQAIKLLRADAATEGYQVTF